MILMEDGGNLAPDSGLGVWPDGEFAGGYEFDGGDDFNMDLDELTDLLAEPGDLSQTSHTDISCQVSTIESATDVGNQENYQLQSGISTLTFNDVKLESSSEIRYPKYTCSGSFKEWISPVGWDQDEKRVGVLQSEIPSCSTASSFVDGETKCVSDVKDKTSLAYKVALSNLNFNISSGETGTQVRHAGGKNHDKDASHGFYAESSDGIFGHFYSLTPNDMRSSGPESNFHRPMDHPLEDTDVSFHNVAATQPTFSHNFDLNPEVGAHHSDVQFGSNFDNTYFVESPLYFEGDFIFDLPSSNELQEFQTESACSAFDISMINYCDDKRLNFTSEGINNMSPVSTNFFSSADDKLVDEKSLGMPFSRIQSAVGKKHLAAIDDEKAAEVAACRSMVYNSIEIAESAERKSSHSNEVRHFVEEDLKQSFSGVSSSMLNQKKFVSVKDGRGDMSLSNMRSQVNEIAVYSPSAGAYLSSNASEHRLSCTKKFKVNKQPSCVKQVRDSKLIRPKCLGNLSSVCHESIQSNLPGSNSHVDSDSEICILEDISQPAVSHQSLAFGKANASSRDSAFGGCINYRRVGSTWPKVNGERFLFQAALQDLSQPKSEASPPEGVLAVPLLRHQRIALSWMVQKETSSLYCSGGILADDQGLGKTVSTIALILKERPPSVKVDLQIIKKEEFETLNLDEDDDEVAKVGQMKEEAGSCQVMSDQGSKKGSGTFEQSKGRPAAGTLVVCPTSVLRQWAEELHKKVTSKANLSVLIYHGSNRTKDPCELAKYDVVLTTYSIVSMEVPKQPLANEDDVEKGQVEGEDVASLGFSSGKKRKYPPSSSKKGSTNKKGMDAALLESVSRPLAKVAWFRVVLDEAQSIKNHRTQVARACWGLRAKRRWCLSGTPIQNAIDDLYSYFRFLRYEPFSVYSSFCSTLKIPIQKSPKKGYKKLQAVLKTIMLRRTKGTHIDGKPIINLPPKVIELKKVDFTSEERDFYSRLESKSRAQFREYAAAGTVKQNYVNILLMLLRLRQACDHPLLVRDADSNYFGRSSMEMAKKLPREKQICLLNCLEASLAICGICNDPPEDAVVSLCGHVFCNQCICEHLSGDDNQCPTSKCKFQLNISSVFSRATLKSSLADQATQDGSEPELVGAGSAYSDGLPYDSSKIRVALEVLKSLKKPQDYRSTHGSLGKNFDGNVTCPENLCGSGNSVNNSDKKHIPSDGNFNGSVKIAGEKAIVFSQWTRMLDLLEARLKSSSIQYRRLDGTMPVAARDKAVKDFNTLPEVSVMIMSLKAASLGLNMVAACRVLLLDLWWNPTTEDQAIDRAHRIGQTRPVTVLRLTVKDTVEDRILALQQKKRKMVASAFGEDGTGGHQTRLTVDDLKYLFMV